MIGTKENFIDMLGVVFANRGYEAVIKASTSPRYKRNEEAFQTALKRFMDIDKKSADKLDMATMGMLNDCLEEAYFLGLQDGYALIQLLAQSGKPYSEIWEEARAKVEEETDILRPFAL